jgi:hypothetical protein
MRLEYDGLLPIEAFGESKSEIESEGLGLTVHGRRFCLSVMPVRGGRWIDACLSALCPFPIEWVSWQQIKLKTPGLR